MSVGPMAQWVAYRYAERAMLRAPLPSASEAGGGWRSIELKRPLPLEQLDALVADTASKVGAALGAASVDGAFGYLIAVGEAGQAVRLVLGLRDAAGHAEGPAAIERAGVDKKNRKRWVARAAKAFGAWSSGAPSAVDADLVAAIMHQEHADPADAVAELFGSLGLSLPQVHPPSYSDLHLVAREQMPPPSKRGRLRRKR